MENKDEKDNAAKTPAAKPFDLLAVNEIIVTLTYVFTDPITSLRFFCKLAMNADEIEARQTFYKQPDGDQAAGQHAYNVDMLSRIQTRPPEIPGFPEYVKDRGFDDWRNGFIAFLAEPTPMAVKIASEAFEMYNRIAQPSEFFR